MAAALLWSTGGLAIKLVPLAGLGVVFWRSAVTFLFLAVVLRPSLARLKTASPASVVVYALMILSFVSATKMTTAANAIFLQYTGPLYVLLLSPVVLKEPFRKADAVAIVAALSGMSLFFVGRLEPGALAGNLMAVASGVFFGGVVLLLRRGAGGDALPSMVLGNLLAALVALPFAWGGLALDGKGLLLVTYLGVVQMGVAYLLFVRGLTVVPAAEASLLGMLEPLFNPVWAFVGIGERPSPWALAGGAVVLLSVAARTLWASRAAR
ncbi:MAG: EamA/RhaT family transporter [Acidobacteria bacterium]|nr:MAG: EamA/RhaT family transporter [Acidobacteriota bacterium]MCE7958943.1 EamA/RhaT family transporter [Acidobacteria bacterium ACB2]